LLTGANAFDSAVLKMLAARRQIRMGAGRIRRLHLDVQAE
jgi:hypothetical protein